MINDNYDIIHSLTIRENTPFFLGKYTNMIEFLQVAGILCPMKLIKIIRNGAKHSNLRFLGKIGGIMDGSCKDGI